ncbi:MAG TPA: G1 family glutamic endopeptidase [Streptosporangiaceae bacterium]|nr:G1 family glutamic endopeptidase [Streptosporangiaceae bacterium]
MRRLLLCSLLALLPAFGMLMGVSSAANARTVPKAPAAPQTQAAQHARAVATALAAIKDLKIGQHQTDLRTGTISRVKALTQEQSTNWAGYADTGSNVSALSGHWTEPSATCGSATSLDVFWVGIDGFSSNTVEQDGTGVECVGGTPIFFSWWEMFPTNSIQVVSESLRPGDSITASVVRSGTSYTLTVTDSTRGGVGFSTRQTCTTCANNSAEWIAEAPSGSGGVEPLTNFGTWNESNSTVTIGGTSGVISSFPDDEITMVNSSGQVKAQPSALNGSGNGFSVTWKRST